MDADAREALDTIQGCVLSGRYLLTRHFSRRLDKRFFFWADVLTVLDSPLDVRDDGVDPKGRPKWTVSGMTADGLGLEFVCVLDRDQRGHLTVFITLYRV